jgi:cold shock CspA family protein
MTHRGVVKMWNRAWGFIIPDMPSVPEVFVHATALQAPLNCLVEGQEVEFDIVPSQRRPGQDCASNVRVL